jgi:hypothetical protein
MKSLLLKIIRLFFTPVFAISLILIWVTIFFRRNFKSNKHSVPRLIWGDHPLQNNQYWSNSLKNSGYKSATLMKWTQVYQNRSTYDFFTDELKVTGLSFLDKYLVFFYAPYIAFTFAIKNYDIFHHHFYGGFLSQTFLKKFEAQILHLMGCKIVITGVGGDFYRYNKIINTSLLTGFLLCYPDQALYDNERQKRINYWVKHADCIMNGFQVDALGRWDVMPFNMVCIETQKVYAKTEYSAADGVVGLVKIFHAPNHRGLKGTEFIVEAVNQLVEEGLKVELVLIEKMQNHELLELLRNEADILVDQLLFGYGLNAIEGMALGLPVVTNLENEEYTRAFRRYSYLNECPAVSGTPESILDVLRVLIAKPDLRKQLGLANRKYAEKYHSEKTATFMFSKIYDKIWNNASIDLMSLFLPLDRSSYNNQSDKIVHPLFENKIVND